MATFPKGKEEKYGGLVCCRLTPSCGGTLYVIVVVGTGGFRGSRSVVSEFSPTLLESSLKVRFLVEEANHGYGCGWLGLGLDVLLFNITNYTKVEV